MLSPTERDDYREVFVEPTILAASYVDDDGRPLAELNAPASLREGVDFEVLRCSYPGSRTERPHNVSALKQFRRRWPTLLREFRQYRRVYLERYDKERLQLADVWRLARGITAIPMYHTRNCERLVSRDAIPAIASLMFKAAQGVHLVAEELLFKGESPHRYVTASELERYAEDGGYFLSPDSGRACSGPPNMIREFLTTFIDGNSVDQAHHQSSRSEDTERSHQLQYGDYVSGIHAERWLLEVEARIINAEIVSQLTSGDCAHALKRSVKSGTGHFGRFSNSGPDELRSAARNLRSLAGDPSPITAGDQARPPPAAQLVDLLRPRSICTSRDLRAMCDGLVRYLKTEHQLVRRLTKRQEEVCRLLGRAPPPTPLSSDDFDGQGFTPREVLARFLEVGLRFEDGQIVLSLGPTQHIVDVVGSRSANEPDRVLF